MKNVIRVFFKILFIPVNISFILIGFMLALTMSLIDWLRHWLEYDVDLGDKGLSLITIGITGLTPRANKIAVLRQFRSISWAEISKSKLTRKEIYEYQDELKWKEISQYQQLTEKDIIAFEDIVVWPNIAKYQDLSEEFIYKYQSKLPAVDLRKNKHFMNIDETNTELALYLRLI